MDNSKWPSINPPAFWAAFTAEMDEFLDAVKSGEAFPTYERIGELLRAAGYQNVYELTSDDQDRGALIFSPESDPAVAELIDWFVSFAPAMPKWVVHNRRQRRPWAEAFEMVEQVYRVDVRDAVFSIAEADGRVNVTMYTEAATFKKDLKRGTLRFFLEHAVGEDLVMRRVGRLAIKRPRHAPEDLSPEDFVQQMLALDQQTPPGGPS
jgi:hypothetical protein